LGRLLTDLVSIWRDTRKEGQPDVVLDLNNCEDSLIVKGREGPLSQVVRNLVENARSFSPENGIVKISAIRADDIVIVLVEDDGPGIPEDKFETIFDRFYSDRPKGASFGNNSGLGLSIVKQIIETHHGKVYAENKVSGEDIMGARFVIQLPLGE
jgi:two-component system sensor histidine kinase ChvG